MQDTTVKHDCIVKSLPASSATINSLSPSYQKKKKKKNTKIYLKHKQLLIKFPYYLLLVARQSYLWLTDGFWSLFLEGGGEQCTYT